MAALTRREREEERLAADPGVVELGRLCYAMQRVARRIGRFRVEHRSCRTTGRGRCLLCATLDEFDDWSGADPHDLLSAAHTALKLASDLIDGERPRSVRDRARNRRAELENLKRAAAQRAAGG